MKNTTISQFKDFIKESMSNDDIFEKIYHSFLFFCFGEEIWYSSQPDECKGNWVSQDAIRIIIFLNPKINNFYTKLIKLTEDLKDGSLGIDYIKDIKIKREKSAEGIYFIIDITLEKWRDRSSKVDLWSMKTEGIFNWFKKEKTPLQLIHKKVKDMILSSVDDSKLDSYYKMAMKTANEYYNFFKNQKPDIASDIHSIFQRFLTIDPQKQAYWLRDNELPVKESIHKLLDEYNEIYIYLHIDYIRRNKVEARWPWVGDKVVKEYTKDVVDEEIVKMLKKFIEIDPAYITDILKYKDKEDVKNIVNSAIPKDLLRSSDVDLWSMKTEAKNIPQSLIDIKSKTQLFNYLYNNTADQIVIDHLNYLIEYEDDDAKTTAYPNENKIDLSNDYYIIKGTEFDPNYERNFIYLSGPVQIPFLPLFYKVTTGKADLKVYKNDTVYGKFYNVFNLLMELFWPIPSMSASIDKIGEAQTIRYRAWYNLYQRLTDQESKDIYINYIDTYAFSEPFVLLIVKPDTMFDGMSSDKRQSTIGWFEFVGLWDLIKDKFKYVTRSDKAGLLDMSIKEANYIKYYDSETEERVKLTEEKVKELINELVNKYGTITYWRHIVDKDNEDGYWVQANIDIQRCIEVIRICLGIRETSMSFTSETHLIDYVEKMIKSNRLNKVKAQEVRDFFDKIAKKYANEMKLDIIKMLNKDYDLYTMWKERIDNVIEVPKWIKRSDKADLWSMKKESFNTPKMIYGL